jgi:hypothetical protein
VISLAQRKKTKYYRTCLDFAMPPVFLLSIMCTIFTLVKSSILTAAKDDVIDYVENKKLLTTGCGRSAKFDATDRSNTFTSKEIRLS